VFLGDLFAILVMFCELQLALPKFEIDKKQGTFLTRATMYKDKDRRNNVPSCVYVKNGGIRVSHFVNY
jgi:hypothetical protein